MAALRGTWSPCGLSMISAINPMAERSRGHRYWLTAVWFVAGSVVGGALLGAIGSIGAWLLQPVAPGPATSSGLAAACCLVAVASDTSLFGFRLPLHPRQVNERWLGQYRRWVYAAGFGAQIGTGFATYIMTAAVYLVPVLGAISGSPTLAMLAGLLFGWVRGLCVLFSATAADPVTLGRLLAWFDRYGPLSLRVVIGVELLAAGVFASSAAGLPGLVVVGLTVAAAVLLDRRTSRRTDRRDQCSAARSDVQVPQL
jgi:MFS family permease